jgi:hypothetical protein
MARALACSDFRFWRHLRPPFQVVKYLSELIFAGGWIEAFQARQEMQGKLRESVSRPRKIYA